MLIYRLFIFLVNASLLTLLITYLTRLGPRGGAWLIGLALTLLLLPTTAGKHIAAETLLFPMLGAAILLIAWGRNFNSPGVALLGLAVGGMATLLKWEAPILLAFGVLPWVVSPLSPTAVTPTLRTWLFWVVVLLAGLLPVAIWKMTLTVENGFFAPITWSRFLAERDLLPRLVWRAFQMILADGRLLFFASLPCAVLLRLRTASVWSALPVPLGVGFLAVAWVLVYMFSSLNPVAYLETSYDRLIMVPVFGAILYGCETFCTLGQVPYSNYGGGIGAGATPSQPMK
jgi:hypothetical protein